MLLYVYLYTASCEKPLKWRFFQTGSQSDTVLPGSERRYSSKCTSTALLCQNSENIFLRMLLLSFGIVPNIVPKSFTFNNFTTVKGKLPFLALFIDSSNPIYYVGAGCPNKSIVVINFPLIFHCRPCSLAWKSVQCNNCEAQ